MSLPTLVETVRKDDDRTVTFVLRQPYAPFLADLAMDFASILSKQYADQLLAAGEREKLDREPVGTGPFQLVENAPGASVRYCRQSRLLAASRRRRYAGLRDHAGQGRSPWRSSRRGPAR